MRTLHTETAASLAEQLSVMGVDDSCTIETKVSSNREKWL